MAKSRIIITSILWMLIQFSYCQPIKVLFLGNSYTASNNLPALFASMAESHGDIVVYDSYTPGGFRLMNHATNATTLSKISSDEWDFVVLQGQSQEPSLDPAFLEEEVFPYASILNDSIKANNTCSETVFFMTWGRKYGDQQNCENWPPVCTFLGMQERLMVGYMMMAENNDATVAPVGLAWKHSMDNDPDSLINLYTGDYSHPSLAGSYLTACVMYATMFHKTVIGSAFYGNLPEGQAIYLQQIASYVVLDEGYGFEFYDPYFEIEYELSWLDWYQNGNIAIADFSIAANGANYFFTNQSINAENFFWDFGDGSTSNLENPAHTYVESGEYTVSQSVNNECFSDVAMDTLNVIISEVHRSFEKNRISLFQAPGSNILDVSIKCNNTYQNMKIDILDNRGMIIMQDYLQSNEGVNTFKINLSANKTGIYFMRLFLDDEIWSKKFILK